MDYVELGPGQANCDLCKRKIRKTCYEIDFADRVKQDRHDCKSFRPVGLKTLINRIERAEGPPAQESLF